MGREADGNGTRARHAAHVFPRALRFFYRNYSAAAHPSLRGLNPVIEEITQTRKRVVLERPYEGPSGPYGMATVIYALALYVASESLGWPVEEDVEAAFAND